MRARTEALLAVLALGLLSFVVGLLARPRAAPSDDERASTFLVGPGGSRALLEALRALHIEVRRFRERPQALRQRLSDGSHSPQALAILGPSLPFSPLERSFVVGFSQQADLVLAGADAGSLMRCFGYRVRRRRFDSVRVVLPGSGSGAHALWVQSSLEATHQPVDVDSSRAFDVGRSSCTVPPVAFVDTLLLSTERRPVALRIQRADQPRQVILVSDEELFRNRALRLTAAGPFALRLFAGRYRRVTFEEYHHGFGASGSLAGATLAWSRRSPWGWAVWQVAVVGLLALLFGGLRFGEAQPGIPRTRRSPLEHVRALAVALSAARGTDQAIGAIVRGLRRRLLPAGLRKGAGRDWRDWLAELERSPASPEVKASLASLEALTRPGQPATSVLRAANAVEDLWQDLRP